MFEIDLAFDCPVKRRSGVDLMDKRLGFCNIGRCGQVDLVEEDDVGSRYLPCEIKGSISKETEELLVNKAYRKLSPICRSSVAWSSCICYEGVNRMDEQKIPPFTYLLTKNRINNTNDTVENNIR